MVTGDERALSSLTLTLGFVSHFLPSGKYSYQEKCVPVCLGSGKLKSLNQTRDSRSCGSSGGLAQVDFLAGLLASLLRVHAREANGVGLTP